MMNSKQQKLNSCLDFVIVPSKTAIQLLLELVASQLAFVVSVIPAVVAAVVIIATKLLLRAGPGPRHVEHFSLEIAFRA